jgi:hypothetical protein
MTSSARSTLTGVVAERTALFPTSHLPLGLLHPIHVAVPQKVEGVAAAAVLVVVPLAWAVEMGRGGLAAAGWVPPRTQPPLLGLDGHQARPPNPSLTVCLDGCGWVVEVGGYGWGRAWRFVLGPTTLPPPPPNQLTHRS